MSIRLFRFRQKAYVIFYKKEENGIRVVRILGSKMDFISHL
ncbi:type II toxin-antitoxin system RelE/ParE family toxin [Ulvibacterium marinum]